jgi:hypothetical protein
MAFSEKNNRLSPLPILNEIFIEGKNNIYTKY